ncbi:MAG: hypothetical protein OEZ02_00845 [Anaerolineae bacterium]|nr:hypothetical protein [Anaerolineae bacterium]
MNNYFRNVPILALCLLSLGACLSAPVQEGSQPSPSAVETQEEIAACKQIVFNYALHGRNHFDYFIYSICADGSDLHPLVNDHQYNFGPSWSPDGTVILYSSQISGSSQLYLMDPDGSNRRQITFGPEFVKEWFWMPDGMHIAVLRSTALPSGGSENEEDDNGGDGAGEEGLVEPPQESWQVVNLETLELAPLTGWSDILLNGRGILSNDGSRIAYVEFSSDAEDLITSTQLHIQNADGSNDSIIVIDFYYLFPFAWSPDDRQIIFIAYQSDWGRTHGEFEIYAVNVDGSNLHKLIDSFSLPYTYEPEFMQHPSFGMSPDGHRLVIFAHSVLYLHDLRSAQTTVVFSVEEPNSIFGFSWQP